jgi:hypothetical protein
MTHSQLVVTGRGLVGVALQVLDTTLWWGTHCYALPTNVWAWIP